LEVWKFGGLEVWQNHTEDSGYQQFVCLALPKAQIGSLEVWRLGCLAKPYRRLGISAVCVLGSSQNSKLHSFEL
ncbi:MAG: hypothetical protein ACOC4H_02220, partial [bacterium]